MKFHPTQNTRLFLSNDSLKNDGKLHAAKKAYINTHDKYAQLRQIRSDFTVPKKTITKETIQSSAMIKDTFVSSAHQKILALFNNQTEIAIFGNQPLERILMDIAEKLTPRLKEANKKVAIAIKESAQ